MASLGNDLASIRKEKDLSLDDLHETTKIPKHILASIENDSIFSSLAENPTYIRSYVRGYAKALSIDEQSIVDALDNLETGDYQGSLQKYLEGEPIDPSELEEVAEPDEEKTSSLPLEAENAPKEWPTEPETPVTQSPNVHSIDWAAMGKRFQPLHATQSRIWILITLLVIVAGAAAYFYFYQPGPSEPAKTQTTESQQQSAPASAADSLQLNIIPTEEEQDISQDTQNTATQTLTGTSTSLEALPDTLRMVVYAAHGKLEPVRVYTDIMESINPYWIEEGKAMRFTFVNEMRIRGNTSRIALLFNGHAIPDIREKFYDADTGMLEITRSFFEGSSRWLSPAPDTLAIDAPPPSAIQDRPIFN